MDNDVKNVYLPFFLREISKYMERENYSINNQNDGQNQLNSRIYPPPPPGYQSVYLNENNEVKFFLFGIVFCTILYSIILKILMSSPLNIY